MYSVVPEYSVVVGKADVISGVGGAVVMMVSGGQVESLLAA